MTEVTGRDSLVMRRRLGAQAWRVGTDRQMRWVTLCPKQATGMGIDVGLAEDQIITGPAVPLTVERRAAPR